MIHRGHRPVKAACLACRASKTRCDGQHPCRPCVVKNRDCTYQPSRRGGPRRRARTTKEIQSGTESHSQVSPLPPSQPPTVIDASKVTTPVTENSTPSSVDPSLWNAAALLSPFSKIEDPARDWNAFLRPPNTESEEEIQGPLLRFYTSDEGILNAYYHFIHPYLPFLPPPPTLPLKEDDPSAFQPSPEDAGTVDIAWLPCGPMSSLTLALSAIFSLIPPPMDENPSEACNVWLRRSYAQSFAQAALRAAEKEIDELIGNLTTSDDPAEGRCFYPQVPLKLHPILALVILSVYECCQCGSISRMRMRANQAITTAMDMSLHQLGKDASEAQRRAWWTAVVMMYQSSVVNMSSPIITIHDPRITTPYPAFDVESSISETWSLLLKAQDAYTNASAIVRPMTAENRNAVPAPNLRSQVCHLDRAILSLAADCDIDSGSTEDNQGEALAARTLRLIACTITHSARIKLHRYRAFSDVPLFLEKHCDLSFLSVDNPPSQAISLAAALDLDSIFPFTQDESSIICLKSSLAVARALRTLPRPGPSLLDLTAKGIAPVGPNSSKYTGTLPFFKCAAMQASYVLYMLVHRVRAALSSKRLPICYPLLNHPEPVTEVQDARRLIEELRSAAHCLILCMKRDLVFEGIAAMIRDLDAAYFSLFPK